MAVLFIVSLNRKGEKEILKIEESYRESSESCRDVLRDIKKQGSIWIGLVITYCFPGFWHAPGYVYTQSNRQHCFVHKMRNELDKVPSKDQQEVREALRAIDHARSTTEAMKLMDAFIYPFSEYIRRQSYHSKRLPICCLRISDFRNNIGLVLKRPI
jgi:putative transposase